MKEEPDSVVSVQEANQFHPILMKKIEDGRLKPIWKDEPEGVPRQQYNPTGYMRNGAVYVFRRELIMNGFLYGEDILPYIMPLERSVCIDDMMDWYVAEAWMNHNNNNIK
jgi:CMP-N-acetylneuraminic acid synthetase